jgi:membrane-bound ClpP family serine protease
MTILVIIFLVILGLFLLLLEFAVIPGVTIAGIGGVIMLIGSVYLGFSRFGTLGGMITLMAILVTGPFMFYYFFRSKAGRKLVLDTNIEGRVEQFDASKIGVGDQGITLGRLAPSGKVKVGTQTMEARSTGAFIDPNQPVRVVKILSNTIIVELIKTE